MSRAFYHVDREGDLKSGQRLYRSPPREHEPEIDVLAEEVYPEGLSNHGRLYFVDDGFMEDTHRYGKEAFFELVRLCRFPERPSRFESYFGFGAVEEAERFVREYGDGGATIWEVAAEEHFRADMRLVKFPDFAHAMRYATHYWEGKTVYSDPVWEVLLVPPVEVRSPVATVEP